MRVKRVVSNWNQVASGPLATCDVPDYGVSDDTHQISASGYGGVALYSYVEQSGGQGPRLCPRPPQYVSIGLWCVQKRSEGPIPG
jgi:hypothetical protein